MRLVKTIVRATSFALLLLGCGCVTPGMPGHVAVQSMQEGERQVVVAPGWLYGGGLSTPAKAGGVWTEKAPDQFDLEVVVIGLVEIKGLELTVDGKVMNFMPTDQPTRESIVNGRNESSRHFVVPLKVIEQMVVAERAVFQIQLPDKVVEARLFEQPTYAKPALREALKSIRFQRGQR